MAYPQFIAATAIVSDTTGAGSVTPSFPTHQVNDILICQALNHGTALPATTSTGWTRFKTIPGSGAGSKQIAWFWKRATATTGEGPVITTTDTDLFAIGYVFRLCVTSGASFEDDTTAGDATTADNHPDTALITTLGGDRLVICLLAVGNDTAWTTGPPPGSWTNDSDLNSNAGDDVRFVCISIGKATAGDQAAIQIGTISANEMWGSVTLALIPSSITITLTAASGSFSLSGQVVALKEKITALSGSLSLAGQNATLKKARILSSESGTFNLSGQVATFDKTLNAILGSVSLSGQVVTFDKILSAILGSVSLSGQVVTFDKILSAILGSINLSGQSVTFDKTLNATLSSFNLSGQNATLKQGRNLPADSGSINLAGQVSLFQYAFLPISGDYTFSSPSTGLKESIVAVLGSYNLAGQDADLIVPASFTAESGTFSLLGTVLTFFERVLASTGIISITGSASLDSIINVNTGVYSLSGSAQLKITESASSGNYNLVGQDAALESSNGLIAESGNLSINGNAVLDENLAVNLGVLSLSGQAATLLVSRLLNAESGNVNLSGLNVTLKENALHSQGTFDLNGIDANLYVEEKLIGQLGSYNLVGQSISFTEKEIAESGGFNLLGQDADLHYVTEILLAADLGIYDLNFTNVSTHKRLNAESREFYAGGPDIPEVGVSVITIARTLIRDNKPMR